MVKPSRTEPHWAGPFNCERLLAKTRNEMMFVWILILLLGSHERALGNGECGLVHLKSVFWLCFTKLSLNTSKSPRLLLLEENISFVVFKNDSFCIFVAFYAVFPLFLQKRECGSLSLDRRIKQEPYLKVNVPLCVFFKRLKQTRRKLILMLNIFKRSSEARGSFPNVSEETRRNVTRGASLSPKQLNISDETSATHSKEQD